MFRVVDLPLRVAGRLLLHSMPGRFETFERVWHQLKSDAVAVIVCLNEKHELRMKSSEYAEALEAGTLPCSVLLCEIREGGVPEVILNPIQSAKRSILRQSRNDQKASAW